MRHIAVIHALAALHLHGVEIVEAAEALQAKRSMQGMQQVSARYEFPPDPPHYLRPRDYKTVVLKHSRRGKSRRR